jgi:pimeloyl-ACP methyl ester carboxylesterase
MGEVHPSITKMLPEGVSDGSVDVGGGRSFSYRAFGAADGHPLIALHGTPGSRLKFAAADKVARAVGIRVIAPDRWGYAATSQHPAPSLARFAEDLGRFAERLGVERFSLLGVSGGGPFASAVAAELPERIVSLALAAPVGPIAGEVDDEITPFHRFCFGALAQRRLAVALVFQAFRGVLGVAPGLGIRMAMLRFATSDRHVLRRTDMATQLGETFQEGLRLGVSGPVTDLALFGRPWEIDLGRAHVPARLWIGTADRNVPCSAARRLARRLPRCDLVEIDGQGHLWIADHYHIVLAWIAAQVRAELPAQLNSRPGY